MTEPVPPLDLRARLLIDGAWTDGFETFDVTDKYTGERIGCADRASRAQVETAVGAAAWKSGCQKWNGNTALLIRNVTSNRAMPGRSRIPSGPAATRSARSAMLSVP